MGKMGKAQDTENHRDADRAQRIDAADGQAGHQIEIDEVDHAATTPPRKERRTLSSDRSSSPVARHEVPATHQHMATIGNAQRLLGILLDHQDRHAGLANIEKQIEDPFEIGGDSPAVGSSSSSSFGSLIRARPIATIWRCPPESSPAGWRNLSTRSGNSVRTLARAARTSFGGAA